MAKDDDLRHIRNQFDSDMDEWAEARQERATDMRYLAGDPWSPDDKQQRDDAGRPYLSLDELSQYVNQMVNDIRANPRSVQFSPTKVGTSEAVSDFYNDKMREIEYRSNAQLAYIAAAESAIQGGYGFVRVTSEFDPESVDQQELWIKPVVDPNTVVPNWNFQRPDLSDMRRCFVLEHRPIDQFKQDFPSAKVKDFGGYLKDKDYSRWVQEDRILLAEYWCVEQEPVKLLLVQPPPVQAPAGMMDMRGPVVPPPFSIPEERWAQMPPGSKVLRTREGTRPVVYQQLVNGVEVLSETTWPGPYIPIAGCMGRILYLDDGGTSKRLLMSAIRLARDPFMAYCFYRTCEIENVGMTTKNPYWAYEGQLDANQQNEIKKSMHEPVAALFAKAKTEATGNEILPLPQRNISEPAIQALSVGAEEMRRGVQSAMATNFLPTAAQGRNEKSKVALDKIDQTFQKGSFHFTDNFELCRRHIGDICSYAIPHFYDSERQTVVRGADDQTAHVWINSPSRQEAVNLDGTRMAVTVSSGPSVDSTREAGGEFMQALLANGELMQLIGPAKASQIAALVIKWQVKQTGIGALGEQIVDIISPPEDGNLTPDQLQQQNQQLKATVQAMQQQMAQLQQERDGKIAGKQIDAQNKIQVEGMRQQGENERAAADREVKLAVAELPAKIANLELFMEERARVGLQGHEMALAAADAAHEKDMAARQTLATLAQPSAQGNGNGAA